MATANDENGEHFFEGAEKLFEVWFSSDDGNGDLRKVDRWGLVTYSVDGQLLLQKVWTNTKYNQWIFRTNTPLYFRSEWESLLTLVNCEIINEKAGPDMKAYILRYVKLTRSS